jgi:integrase
MTIRHHHAFLRGALHQAVRWGWITRSPADTASPPRADSAEPAVPSVEQVRALLVLTEAKHPDLGNLLWVAAITGMRRGELCGLRWSDVDLVGTPLAISQTRIVVKAKVLEGSRKQVRAQGSSPSTPPRWRDFACGGRYRRATRWPVARDGPKPASFSPCPDGTGVKPQWVSRKFRRLARLARLGRIRQHDRRHAHITVAFGSPGCRCRSSASGSGAPTSGPPCPLQTGPPGRRRGRRRGDAGLVDTRVVTKW